MKKVFILILFLFFIYGCSNVDNSNEKYVKTKYDNKEIESIDYKLENVEAGIIIIKQYNFLNLTYFESMKDYGGFIKEDVNLSIDESKINEFRKNIVQNGIYNLKEKYEPIESICDASSWYLTINFVDGTVFKSQGYYKFPNQKDNLDNSFYNLSGYNIFENGKRPYRDDVYKLDTITITSDGETYGVYDLDYNFEDNTLFEFGINEETEYKLIDTYYDYISISSILKGEVLEQMDHEIVNQQNSDNKWLYVKRTTSASNLFLVNYNLLNVYKNKIEFKINYLDKDGFGDDYVGTCYDLIRIPISPLIDLENGFSVVIN